MAEPPRPDDDLTEVVASLRAGPRPLLLALDIDGTLSPIVAHASAARLAVGVGESLLALSAQPDVHVALVTGRSVADARTTFGLPDSLTVVGSHGREMPGIEVPPDNSPRMWEVTLGN